jgi:hypothetical protein
MALQRLGDADLPPLLAVAADWAGGGPLLQRAAIAGVCEPRLLAASDVAEAVLALVDRVHSSEQTGTGRGGISTGCRPASSLRQCPWCSRSAASVR